MFLDHALSICNVCNFCLFFPSEIEIADKQEYVDLATLDLELDDLKLGKMGRGKRRLFKHLYFFGSELYRDDELSILAVRQ